MSVPFPYSPIRRRRGEVATLSERRQSWQDLMVCLDGTNKAVGSRTTNAVRLFPMLDLSHPDQQVNYYDPGVHTS
jgi:uncharacterized protein (DUF2235 family)